MSQKLPKQARRERCPQDITFAVHYPEENPEGAIDDITRALVHAGALSEIELD